MIDGVIVTRIEVASDERGREISIHAPTAGDPPAARVDLRTAYPDVTLPWRRRADATVHVVCTDGMVKLALADLRADSPTRGEAAEVHAGIWQPVRVTLPPGVAYAARCVSTTEAVLLECVAAGGDTPPDPPTDLPPDAADLPTE